jgi:cyclohexyl-isocyanide hydratase
MLEYDPKPPFDAGSPDKAGPKIVEMSMLGMMQVLERLTGGTAA